MVQLRNLSPLIPNLSVNIQISTIEEAGLDPEPVLAAAGLTRADLDDATLMVSGAQELAVQLGFAQLTQGHRELWVTLGRRYRLFVYYPLGFALITAPSLDKVIRLTQHFSALHFGLMSYESIVDGDGNPGIEARYVESLAHVRDYLSCRDVIAATTWLHELWGGTFPFVRVETASPLPGRYGFDYKAPVIETGGPTRWFWPQSLMAMQPFHSDPVLHKVYVAQCESILAQAVTGQPTADALTGPLSDPLLVEIMGQLEQSGRFDWTLDQLAGALAMSRRSLQRRLAELGVTFRMIMDDNRYRAARRLLRRRGPSIAEIAWQLGFADASSFHQAFTRWAQMSPTAYRKGK